MAETVAGLRAGVRPRDLIGRVQWLLLAFALLNAAGALVVVLVSAPTPPVLALAGLAAPPALALAWASAYRRRSFGPITDAVTIAGVCAITMAVSERWDGEVIALLSAAVFFSASYGSLFHVMARTGLLAAIELGEGLSDPAALTMAVFFAVGFVLVAILMYGMSASIRRYEATAGRAQILAAAGLDLVAASDLPGIAASAVEGAYALCAALPGVRASLAIADDEPSAATQYSAEPAPGSAPGSADSDGLSLVVSDAGEGIAAGVANAEGPAAEGPAAEDPAAESAPDALAETERVAVGPRRFTVLGTTGESAEDWRSLVLEAAQLAPAGQPLSGQHVLRRDANPAGDTPASELPPSPFAEGETLVTGISVGGETRGVIVVESPEPIPSDVRGSIRALAVQVSLAIGRADLQKNTVERQSAQRFAALIQASSDVISIVSPDGYVRFQSPAVRQVFGYDPDQMIGTRLDALIHPDDAERVRVDFRQVVADRGASCWYSIVCECRIRHADGSWRHTETRMTNLVDVPAIDGVVLNSRDVTERHSLEAELRHQAFHDSLTGLANRALFANRIEHALVHAKRDGSTVAVMCCDMDGFDRLNDGLGYRSGDAAVTMIADRLRSCVRGQDTIARLGGNEFGLLLDRLTSPADATLAMERLMAALRQPLALPGASVELQPHIGIAIAVGGSDTAEDLLRYSALAVRTARVYEGGYAIFDPEMHADAMRRLEMESQLREAIEESQFVLYYQPTIDLQTGRLTGVEALVRWQHPRRGLVPPLEFIPLAEESGLIVPLGRWTIQEACRQVHLWQQEIPFDEPIAVSVNLSARQLRHPNLVRDVADALDDSGLPPSRLILEITESVLMTDTSATLNRLFQLKSLGVRLAVDDFGTGYSSFAYLRRFPFDILKIDKSFVDGVATEPTASALVDAMIRIGKTLRLETVAEGIERPEQADRLRTLQCDIGQGYLFSRPLARDSLTAFLHERAAQQQASAA